MKAGILTLTLLAVLIALASFSYTTMADTRADDVITEEDPSGDVENVGFDSTISKNADIVSFEVDQSSDPVVFTFEVVGLIEYENATLSYTYAFYLDNTGDGLSNTNMSIIVTSGSNMAYGDAHFGTEYFVINPTGNGTDTLEFEIGRGDLGVDSHPIAGISASVQVFDYTGYPVKTAVDHVNEDFGSGSTGDDDTDDDDDDYDSDNDDLPDEWEIQYGLDTSIDDSDVDSDGDGFTNEQEYLAGTAPDDINSYPDFVVDDDDDDDDDNDLPDPLKETPTDDSIGVEIEKIEYSLDTGDNFELEQKTEGSTDGDVHHCSITYVTYYDDGSYETDEWTDGPDIQDRESLFGITFEYYFKGTGSGGKDDWSEWALYSYAKGPSSFYDDFIDEDESGGGDGKKMTEVYVVVRAYSDSSETKWNQDSQELTELYENVQEGEEFSGTISLTDDEDEESTSSVLFLILGCLGLTLIVLVVIIIIVVILLKKKATKNE